MEHLRRILELPEFQMALEELDSFRPIVPKYSPGQSLEDEEHNLRQIKYATAKQEGFDFLMNLLRK